MTGVRAAGAAGGIGATAVAGSSPDAIEIKLLSPRPIRYFGFWVISGILSACVGLP